MKPSEAAKLYHLLAAAWPAGKGTEETEAVYCTELVELEFEVAALAVKRLLRTAKFFPSLAEIFEAAEAVREKRPSFDPAQLPTRAEIHEFYEARRFTPETFREFAPPKPREPMSGEDLKRRQELLREQARQLLEQEGKES